MVNDMRPEDYRKRQISQWEFPPQDAFVAYRPIETGLTKLTCAFIFYEKPEDRASTAWGNLVMQDCSDELKEFLRNAEARNDI